MPVAGSIDSVDDLLRRVVRDFLDVHAAFGRDDEGDARRGAIDEQGQIEFAIDRRALFDIEAIDDLALRAGLMRDQRHAKHAVGLGAYVRRSISRP